MLSVIMPCFNRGDRVASTLLSLRDFSGGPLEILVVDDGSTDETVRVAETALIGLRKSGISGQVIRSHHRGACAARNTGLKMCTGEYVLFLDSDDPADVGGLAVLIRALESEAGPEIAYGWVWVEDEEYGQRWRKGTPIEKCRNMIFDHPWHTSGAIYRRDLLQRSGGWDESLSLGDDWEFAARARLNAKGIRYEDVCVGHYVQHSSGRLIARDFDEGKSRSVVRAALGIRRAAREHGCLDNNLEKRVYRRLLVQSCELVIYSRRPQSYLCLLAICAAQKTDILTRSIATLFLWIPVPFFRKWLYARLRAKSLA